jgi:hypothetical protein
MSERTDATKYEDASGFNRGFEGHWRRQVRLGLSLTPVERLRWLEQTMEELRPLVGRARRGHPVTSEGSGSPMDAGSCGDEASET